MKILLLIALLVPALACAELTPPPGDYDPRVRVVDYNPLNVIRISTFFGASTQIQFSKSETIKDIALGDEGAWTIKPRGNNLFLKPKAQKGDTNLTVVTDRRSYQFTLTLLARPLTDEKAWSDPNLIYSLSFRYPDEELAAKGAEQKKSARTNQLAEINALLADAKYEIQNYDYWVAGSEEIAPSAARDDGRFIYLTFSNNRDMPAVYQVDAEGNEARINTNVVDGNTVVVQRLVPRLILRKGDAVASVVNMAFRPNGGTDNDSGTVSPDVERVIKGTQE